MKHWDNPVVNGAHHLLDLLDWWFQTLLVVFHPKKSQVDCSNYYIFVKATRVEKPPAVDVIAPGVD